MFGQTTTYRDAILDATCRVSTDEFKENFMPRIFTLSLVFLSLALISVAASAAPIHEAVRRGDLAKVRVMLNVKPETAKVLVNARDEYGSTALHMANYANGAMVALLLAKGGDANAKRQGRQNPALLRGARRRRDRR